MNANTILHDLTRQGLHLSAHGDTLRVEPRERITDAARATIRQHKPALLALLTAKARQQEQPETADAGTEADAPQAAQDAQPEADASALVVIAYTAFGAALTVQARGTDHATQIRKWNPKPPPQPTAPTRTAPSGPIPKAVAALAEAIAQRLNTTPAYCLLMLDEEDRQAIATGSDPGRAEVWRGYVALALERGDIRPAQASPATVRCADCDHALATGHAVMVDCGRGRQGPGCSSAWWATDLHFCADFDAVTPAVTEETR